jgi:hypothetical protein
VQAASNSRCTLRRRHCSCMLQLPWYVPYEITHSAAACCLCMHALDRMQSKQSSR